ncbi:hypothetical protein N566_16900 [Streptomycetaceae bacterium MP113-05]|nr:hypothetical protein N566_16900 [Streptomycetaceae bacterium MP113-05]
MKGPTGLVLEVLKLPVHLYRLGLGDLFGRRMLLINHLGRVTGKRRQTVVEVINHDKAEGSYLVASGWGPGAAWYRNLMHTPEASIQIGRKTIPVTAVPLPEDEAVEIMTAYYVRNRAAAKQLLPRLYGYSVDGSTADFREVAKRVPAIRFMPRT